MARKPGFGVRAGTGTKAQVPPMGAVSSRVADKIAFIQRAAWLEQAFYKIEPSAYTRLGSFVHSTPCKTKWPCQSAASLKT